MKTQSLSKQLLVGFGLSSAILGIATLGVNYELNRVKLQQRVEEQAASITQSLEFSTEGLLESKNQSILRRVVQNFATMPAIVEVAIVRPDGSVLVHSSEDAENMPYRQLRPELATVIQQTSIKGIAQNYEFNFEGRRVLTQVHPFSSILFGNSGKPGLAIAILDLHQIQRDSRAALLTSTLTLVTGIIILLLAIASLIQHKVLRPIKALNDEVAASTRTGTFAMPKTLPNNEIYFLATTFDTVIKQIEAYDQLKAEMAQRKQIEAVLRESEIRERKKSRELEDTLRELKQAQAQLVHSEKMSSLGQLVAGIAHEINNPVNFIHGNLQHANQYMDDLLSLVEVYQSEYPNPSTKVQQHIDDIEFDFLQEDFPKLFKSMHVGADRIREIVLSLRTFSRLDEAEVKNVNIHEGLDSTLMILQNRLKAKADHPEIVVIKEYGNIPEIECYAGQLNQVFMNILTNAIDALDEAQATHKHKTQNLDLTHLGNGKNSPETYVPSIHIRTEHSNPNYLSIWIEDNGPGMAEEVRQQLFDPFFTTKPVGKGTGMGMSISHQIITERHKGQLKCSSTVGKGTTFLIEVPIRLDM